MNIKKVKQKKQKNENDMIAFERHLSMQEGGGRDSFRLGHHRGLTNNSNSWKKLSLIFSNDSFFQFENILFESLNDADLLTT
jgi:hypothetical protein